MSINYRQSCQIFLMDIFSENEGYFKTISEFSVKLSYMNTLDLDLSADILPQNVHVGVTTCYPDNFTVTLISPQ